MAEFIDELHTDEWEVETPNGWMSFDGIGKTIQYQVYEIRFDNGSVVKCADKHIFMLDDREVFCKDLKIDDDISCKTGYTKVKDIIIHDKSDNMYDLLNVDGSVYYTNDIVSHNSTLVAVYLVWYSIFNKDKNVGVVSNKEESAIDIVDRCKLIYEELPEFLKPGITEYNKKTIVFENGTTIKGAATSKNSFRGRTMNVIFADELAFVEPAWLADAFWMSNYPTISKSRESKFIIVSTPNGLGNLFHSIFTKAEKGINAFKFYKADWRCVPERDDKWAAQERSNMGKLRFNQEYGCHFLGSANTVIDEDVLKKLLDQPDPDIIVTNEKGNFRVYEKPIQGATYIIGCDCAKGTGEHFSTMQVCRLVSVKPVKVKQVAVFEDNYTDTYDFAALIDKTSKHYNDAYLMVENNGEGSAVISELWWTHENEGLVCTGTKTVNLGIRATTKTKPRAVILMKKLIEDGSLEIIDPPTINQLLTFVERGQNKFSGNGNPDDLVSALYWTPWIFEMDILEESMEFVKKSENNEEFWGEIISNDDLDSDTEGYEIIQRW